MIYINFKKFCLREKHHLTPIRCSCSEYSNSNINKKRFGDFPGNFFFIGKDFKSVPIYIYENLYLYEIANVFPRLNSSTILNCQILSYAIMPRWALSNSPFISKLICFQKAFMYILTTVKRLFEVALTLLQRNFSWGQGSSSMMSGWNNLESPSSGEG